MSLENKKHDLSEQEQVLLEDERRRFNQGYRILLEEIGGKKSTGADQLLNSQSTKMIFRP